MSATHGQFPNWPVADRNREINHAASIAASECDLLYYDTSTHTVKPVSSIADAGSAPATQTLAAQWFAGVGYSKQRSTDATGWRSDIEIDRIWEFACVSQTWEIGDLVTPKWTTVVGLSDQILDKTTNPALAIGRVVRREAVATTKIKVRITSRILAGFLQLTGAAGGGSSEPPLASVAPITGGTITASNISSSQILAPAGNITGVIIAPGTVDGQTITLINNSAFTITMAATGTSNVADGVTSVVKALAASRFIWVATPAKWFNVTNL